MHSSAAILRSALRPACLAAGLALACLLPTTGEAAPQEDANKAGAGGSAEQSKVQTENKPRLSEELVTLALEAEERARSGDMEAGRTQMQRVLTDPAFDSQPTPLRAAVLQVAGWMALASADYEDARHRLLQATALDPDHADPWYWLAGIELQLGNPDQGALHLARMARGWPELLDNIHDSLYWRFVRELDADAPARTELLQTLFDSGWERRPLGGASALWYELALIRANEGDQPALAAVVARIDGPDELVKLRSDRRFDAVVDRANPDFDPRRAAELRIVQLRRQADLAPRRLDVLQVLQAALLTAGRHEDAIALADQALAAAEAGTDASPAYDDLDDLPWLLNGRATALLRLGRPEEAVAQLEVASRKLEEGRPNVSQALNFGQLLASVGRPDDALAAAARAGSDISDYGRMVQASVRQRAALQKGDAAAAETALATLRSLRATSEWNYLESLVEAGEMDAAEESLTSLLASLDDRGPALFKLQGLRKSPPLQGTVETDTRWEELLARPEVVAAVARVGRILDYDIYGLD